MNAVGHLVRIIVTEDTCLVCHDSVCAFAVGPCGHMCLCAVCATKELRKCPFCESEVKSVTRIFCVGV